MQPLIAEPAPLSSRVCSLVWPLHYVRSCMGWRSRKRQQSGNFMLRAKDTTVELRKRGEKEVFARRMKGVLADDFLPVKTTPMLHHAIVTFCLRVGTITDPASGSFLLFDMHTKVILCILIWALLHVIKTLLLSLSRHTTHVQQAGHRLICGSHDDSLRMELLSLLPPPASDPSAASPAPEPEKTTAMLRLCVCFTQGSGADL